MDGVAVSIETVTDYSPRSPRKVSNLGILLQVYS